MPVTEAQLFLFFFILLRTMSVLVFVPIWGDRGIPILVKILFGFALSFAIFPLAWGQGTRIDEGKLNSSLQATVMISSEIFFGVLTGFIARWTFDAVQFAGYFIGTSMGFSMGTVLDPHSEMHTIALAELQYILAALLFLAIDGHHLFLVAITHSFKALPFGEIQVLAHSDTLARYLIQMTAEVISLGVKLATPVVLVILLSNLMFSLLARAVSQMNVLVVSFTANLIIGFAILFISLPSFSNMVETAFNTYTPEILRFMRLLHG